MQYQPTIVARNRKQCRSRRGPRSCPANFCWAMVLFLMIGVVPSPLCGEEPWEAAVFVRQSLWEPAPGGYQTFHFPAIVVTRRGTVLAFCTAGRDTTAADEASQVATDRDLLMRSSVDGGRTWSDTRVLASEHGHALGPASPLVDRATGTVWLPFNKDQHQIMLLQSGDDGQTWSAVTPIAAKGLNAKWKRAGVWPGHGIQLADGRLAIPCWARQSASADEDMQFMILFSDDQGQEWQFGGGLAAGPSDAGAVVELTDGSLRMILHGAGSSSPTRGWAMSFDGGVTWSPITADPLGRDAHHPASIIRLSDHRQQDRDRLLLAAPNAPNESAQMTVWTSDDEGVHWRVARVVDDGEVAASDMVVTWERQALLSYEAGKSTRIELARFNLAGVTNRRQTSRDPVIFSRRFLSEPRPLCVHQLRLDVRDRRYEIMAAAGDDPDGDGPVEALLTSPIALAKREGLQAGVNTNAWEMLPRLVPEKQPQYVEGGSTDISGWVQIGDRRVSPPTRGHWSFWIDGQGRAAIGSIEQPADAVTAVAGFGGLLRGGEILPESSEARHPRTALGLDRAGQWLVVMVIDGRQPGYSEGVSERELAVFMKDAGCWDAINLDGGGSSIMLLGQNAAGLEIMNRPSDVVGPRPIPAMIGLRPKR